MTTNRTPLVLLPGLDGTDIFFGPLLRQLPPWIEPIVVTYPQGSIRNYEDLLPSVLDRLEGLDSFAVLGWSFGGPLALMVATRFPSKVSAVILCGTFVTPPLPRLVPFRFALVGPVITTLRVLRRLRLLRPGTTTELRQAKARAWSAVSGRALAARARAALAVDVRSDLAAVRAPLMYLASTDDEAIPRRSLDEIVEIAPHTRIEEIEGRHFALFDNPQRARQAIEQFCRPSWIQIAPACEDR